MLLAKNLVVPSTTLYEMSNNSMPMINLLGDDTHCIV
jgi:hypothetical protein